MLPVRRLLVALLLAVPLVATGVAPLAPARADDGRAQVYFAFSTGGWTYYGDPVVMRIQAVTESGPFLGPVEVLVDGEPIGTAVLEPTPNAWTETRFTFPEHLEPGDYQLSVSFAGDDRFAPTTSYEWPYQVAPAETGVTLTADPPAPWATDPVTLTATVTTSTDAATPTGTISFLSDGDVVAERPLSSDGTATYTTPALPAGPVSVEAQYSGDDRFEPGSDGLDLFARLVPTTTTVVPPSSPLTYGNPAPVLARVVSGVAERGAPTGGSVTFTVDGRGVASVPAEPAEDPNDGLASRARHDLALSAGQHRVTVSYAGSPGFAPSSAASFDLVVAKRPTRVTAAPVLLSLNPFALPSAVLRATVTGNGAPVPGAPVTFTAGRTALCTATTDAAGVATCDARAQLLALTLSAGYVATYAGDANNIGSSARGGLVG